MNVADGGCNPIMDSGAFGTTDVTLNDTSRELYPYIVRTTAKGTFSPFPFLLTDCPL